MRFANDVRDQIKFEDKTEDQRYKKQEDEIRNFMWNNADVFIADNNTETPTHETIV